MADTDHKRLLEMAADTPTPESEEIKRCACGYPAPCTLKVPIGFCRQSPPAAAIGEQMP